MPQGIVIASFGTRYPEGEKDIGAVEAALRAEAGDIPCVRAYTSGIVRKKLAEQGVDVPDVSGALGRLRKEGAEDVFVQPTHILPGAEYEKLKAAAEKEAPAFHSLKVGQPLLSGTEDLLRFAEGLKEAYPSDDGFTLFMGHGSGTFADLVYPALQEALNLAGRRDMTIATVEGWPALDDVIGDLAASAVTLVPLMLVAGDHAANDMAGEGPDSWKSRLENENCVVRCVMTGLGREAWVQDLYRRKLRALLAQD